MKVWSRRWSRTPCKLHVLNGKSRSGQFIVDLLQSLTSFCGLLRRRFVEVSRTKRHYSGLRFSIASLGSVTSFYFCLRVGLVLRSNAEGHKK